MHNPVAYEFIFVGGNDNSYVFKTVANIIYEIKFKNSDYIFGKNSPYTQNTFEFVIDILQTSDIKSPPLDSNISITTAQIFHDFFKNEQNIIVYTCETNDMKHNARFRKFNQWSEYFNDGTFEKNDYELKEKVSKLSYFSSIIIKNNNPNKYEIISEFEEVMKQYSK